MPDEVPVKVKSKKQSLSDLDWKPIDFTSAQQRFKFKVYSMRVGAISKYMISTTTPRGFWQELAGKPGGVTFEEAKTKEFNYCRLLKNNLPEQGAIVKTDR